MAMSRVRITPLLVAVLFGLAVGCTDKSLTVPEDQAPVFPALTAPESLLSAIQFIYNDSEHSADDRLAAYASLLDSGFTFQFETDFGTPGMWFLDEELLAHRAIFDAQSAGSVASIELRLRYDAAQDLEPAQPGREGWQEVFVSHVYLRLMLNETDGLEVNGDQAEFRFPPAVGGRYSIGEWIDLRRPRLGRGTAIEPAHWVSIKAFFWLRPSGPERGPDHPRRANE